MGQVVTSAEMRRVVDANLKGYIEQATGSYARLFGKSPTFVTYYTRDPLTSMADVNLGGAIQLIGPESPIKYQIIHDFPIYGVSEADASSAYEELQGVVSNNVRGEAYVLPGTIAPNENDFFIIDYLDARILFRAVSVNPDRIEGKSFYKLEYILDPSDPMQLGRQTNASFTFELATVGTGANPLIETDVAVLLREMEVLEEYHREAYWRAFYDRGSGALLLRSGFPGPVHDRSVDMFVRRNSLLGGQGYMKSRTVRPPNTRTAACSTTASTRRPCTGLRRRAVSEQTLHRSAASCWRRPRLRLPRPHSSQSLPSPATPRRCRLRLGRRSAGPDSSTRRWLGTMTTAARCAPLPVAACALMASRLTRVS